MELPNVNDMSVQDKTKLIRELLANMINNKNSDTNMMLQLLTEAARMDAINRAASPPADDDAPPADHDAPPADDDDALPADADFLARLLVQGLDHLVQIFLLEFASGFLVARDRRDATPQRERERE